jgi:hypothetical protein
MRALEVSHPELPGGQLVRAEIDTERLGELEEARAGLHRISVQHEG